DVWVTAEDGPADRDAVAGAVHRGAREAGRLRRPEAPEYARDAGDGSGGSLAEDLVVVVSSRLHVVERSGDVLGRRDVPRVGFVVRLIRHQHFGGPFVSGRVPLVPGDDAARLQQGVDGFEARVVVDRAVLGPRDVVP